MIQWKPLTLEQAPLLKEYFDRSENRLCDQTLGGALMWRSGFDTFFAHEEGALLLSSRLSSGKRAFTMPLGNVEKGLDLLECYAAESGEPLVFCSVGEEDKEKLLARFPKMTATPTRDWFDYLYLAEKFKGFPGKKLSGQRNHRNYFLKNRTDWKFHVVTTENLHRVKEYFSRYAATNEKFSSYFEEEKVAVAEVLEHLSVYGFFGGFLEVEGEVVAFSFGEILGDTLFIHIEKAEKSVRGAYQMILSEFVTHFAHEGVLYVNREEDVGDPGLRYSKEAYHPHKLLAKYIVERE